MDLDRLEKRRPRVEEVRLLERQNETARSSEVVRCERSRNDESIPALVKRRVAEQNLVGVCVAKRMPHGEPQRLRSGDPSRVSPARRSLLGLPNRRLSEPAAAVRPKDKPCQV